MLIWIYDTDARYEETLDWSTMIVRFVDIILEHRRGYNSPEVSFQGLLEVLEV
jgi:hypothetical protein